MLLLLLLLLTHTLLISTVGSVSSRLFIFFFLPYSSSLVKGKLEKGEGGGQTRGEVGRERGEEGRGKESHFPL